MWHFANRQVVTLIVLCLNRQHLLTVYFSFILFLGKKAKKKGKTLTLTDFLAEDSGSGGGGNIAPSYSNKSTSWADETDDLDGDGEHLMCHFLF